MKVSKFLLALSATVLLAGCGGGGASSSVPSSSKTPTPSASETPTPSESEEPVSSSEEPGGAVEVKFTVTYDTGFGNGMYLSGDFNEWKIETTYRGEWGEGNVWTITTIFNVGTTIKYKFVVANYDTPSSEGATWEADPDRELTVTEATTVECTWQAPAA